MCFACIIQRLETSWQQLLQPQIMSLSWPAIHLQCPYVGAVLISTLKRLLAIQFAVHL